MSEIVVVNRLNKFQFKIIGKRKLLFKSWKVCSANFEDLYFFFLFANSLNLINKNWDKFRPT